MTNNTDIELFCMNLGEIPSAAAARLFCIHAKVANATVQQIHNIIDQLWGQTQQAQ